MNEYAVEYGHDGATWALNFYAEDIEDAQRKIASLRSSAVLVGQTAARIPVCVNEYPTLTAELAPA